MVSAVAALAPLPLGRDPLTNQTKCVCALLRAQAILINTCHKHINLSFGQRVHSSLPSLSSSPCRSEVHRVRLSRSSCMMRVESL
jgi:hypothetical protein